MLISSFICFRPFPSCGKTFLASSLMSFISKSKNYKSICKCTCKKWHLWGQLSSLTDLFVTVVWKRNNNTLLPIVLFPEPRNILSGKLGLHCLRGRRGIMCSCLARSFPVMSGSITDASRALALLQLHAEYLPHASLCGPWGLWRPSSSSCVPLFMQVWIQIAVV